MVTFFFVSWSSGTRSPNYPDGSQSLRFNVPGPTECGSVSPGNRVPFLGTSTSDPAEPGAKGTGNTMSLAGSLEEIVNVSAPASAPWIWDLRVLR